MKLYSHSRSTFSSKAYVSKQFESLLIAIVGFFVICGLLSGVLYSTVAKLWSIFICLFSICLENYVMASLRIDFSYSLLSKFCCISVSSISTRSASLSNYIPCLLMRNYEGESSCCEVSLLSRRSLLSNDSRNSRCCKPNCDILWGACFAIGLNLFKFRVTLV